MVSHDNGHFSLKRYCIICFFRGSRAVILLFKPVCHHCAEYDSAATEINTFNDMMTSHKKKFSSARRHKSGRRKSGVHLDYVVLCLIITVHGIPQCQRTSFFQYNITPFRFEIWGLNVLYKKCKLHFLKDNSVI